MDAIEYVPKAEEGKNILPRLAKYEDSTVFFINETVTNPEKEGYGLPLILSDESPFTNE